MTIFPLAPDQTIAQMWSNGVRGELITSRATYRTNDNIGLKVKRFQLSTRPKLLCRSLALHLIFRNIIIVQTDWNDLACTHTRWNHITLPLSPSIFPLHVDSGQVYGRTLSWPEQSDRLKAPDIVTRGIQRKIWIVQSDLWCDWWLWLLANHWKCRKPSYRWHTNAMHIA